VVKGMIHPLVKVGRRGNGVAIWTGNRRKTDSDQGLEPRAIDCAKLESRV
jgi:hypothetical protein